MGQRTNAATKVVVKQPEPPVETPVLAEAIVAIGAAAKALAASGLNRTAVIVLVADRSKVPKKVIRTVLDSLADLQRAYCR